MTSGQRRIAVTGTDTGVGKTWATAALAQAFLLAGRSVVVVKPVQTGVDSNEPTDADEINRLVGAPVAEEWQRLALPLAPESIAHETGAELTPVAAVVDRLRSLAADVVIVEGAGGVLVGLDAAGGTIADLAALWDAEVVVVTRDTLGTLNHTGLTVEHLRSRDLEPVLMIGMDTGNERNRRDLVRRTRAELVGSVPSGNPESADIDSNWLGR
jgi:dethiobiotin synthetase